MENCILFTAGGRDFSIQDAFDFAEARGRLAPLRQETRESLACRQYAQEHGFELDSDELQGALESWRYSHDLISSQDTRAWLERYGLSIEDLSEYFETRQWRKRFLEERERICSEYPPAQEEVARRIGPDVIISWRLKALAADLAWHATSLVEMRGTIPDQPLPALIPDLESCFSEIRARILTPESCQRQLAASRLSLLRVEFEAAAFVSRDQAQEAAFCVREDGEELRAVSLMAGVKCQRDLLFADDLPPEVRDRCLSASPGEAFVLPDSSGGFQVVRLLRKGEPDLKDDSVRERIETQLLALDFAALVQQHISWHQDL